MHFSTALLPLALLVSYVAAQSSAAAAPAAATGSSSTTCQGQNVLEACLSSTTAIANACQSTDYTCLCTSWNAVLTYVPLVLDLTASFLSSHHTLASQQPLTHHTPAATTNAPTIPAMRALCQTSKLTATTPPSIHLPLPRPSPAIGLHPPRRRQRAQIPLQRAQLQREEAKQLLLLEARRARIRVVGRGIGSWEV